MRERERIISERVERGRLKECSDGEGVSSVQGSSWKQFSSSSLAVHSALCVQNCALVAATRRGVRMADDQLQTSKQMRNKCTGKAGETDDTGSDGQYSVSLLQGYWRLPHAASYLTR
jgi:hypothetical protein